MAVLHKQMTVKCSFHAFFSNLVGDVESRRHFSQQPAYTNLPGHGQTSPKEAARKLSAATLSRKCRTVTAPNLPPIRVLTVASSLPSS